MGPRLDIRLPSLGDADRGALESAVGRIPLPPDEIWVVSLVESAPAEWLLLLTGGGERAGFLGDWTFVAVEEGEGGERVCTYARRLPAEEQSPAAVARSVERLLRAGSRGRGARRAAEG